MQSTWGSISDREGRQNPVVTREKTPKKYENEPKKRGEKQTKRTNVHHTGQLDSYDQGIRERSDEGGKLVRAGGREALGPAL